MVADQCYYKSCNPKLHFTNNKRDQERYKCLANAPHNLIHYLFQKLTNSLKISFMYTQLDLRVGIKGKQAFVYEISTLYTSAEKVMKEVSEVFRHLASAVLMCHVQARKIYLL